MWIYDKGRVKLDLSQVRSEFKMVKDGDLTLIFPDKGSYVSYSDEEKKLRSIIVDKDGFIVSSAWPKFGNWGEFPNDTKILELALKNSGTVRFSHKEDGSLCIRSVVNGKVIFRTRGTMYGGEANEDGPSFGQRFLSVAEKKYPQILNPSLAAEMSLLFEYVAPSNTIVVKYKEEDLVFLGYIHHNNLSIGRWHYVKKFAQENNLNLVRLHKLPRDPEALKEEIKMWRDEGVVVRCNGDQTFVKVKSAWYLANHRMKSNMRYDMILELLESLEIVGGGKEDQFEEVLKQCGYDWEIIEAAKEFYVKYVAAYENAQNVLRVARETYNKFILDCDGKQWDSEAVRRKEFAKIAVSLKNPYTPMAFNVYSSHEQKIQSLIKKLIYRG